MRFLLRVSRALLPCARALLPFAFVLLPCSASAQITDLMGLPIIDIRVQQEGRAVDDRLILGLLETEIGRPLSMRDVRQTIDHLYGLGRFDDVQVSAERSGDGVVVSYALVPRHEVQQVDFRGSLGLRQSELRQAMAERFGTLPPAGRADDVARALLALYRERGYVQAAVMPRIEERHDPDRAILIFDIEAGPRASVRRVELEGLDAVDRTGLLNERELRPGQPYDRVAIAQRLQRYENNLRARGYYEARATHSADFTSDGGATVMVAVDRGPRVSIAFAGDPLPADVRDELVPIRREGSVDQDLLEDAARNIADYLHARGYRDATADYTRDMRGDELVITFVVNRGARHILEAVEVRGNTAMPGNDVRERLGLSAREPFVEAALQAGIDAVRDAYRGRGFTRVSMDPVVSVLPPADGRGADRHVQVTVTINEGPRTVVAAIFLQGNTVLTEGQVRALMTTAPGRPYSELQVAQDRDRIQLEYLNRGYQSVVVDPHVTLSENDTRADIRIVISEGPQVIVDHVIIVGNERTSLETIEGALLLKPGEPLGYAARLESQQRLAALGLFRRVDITELRHGSEPRRDVLVQVEEAPPTTIGVGGGVEVDSRPRPTGEGGEAEERIEIAPRGFFEIGRRNLWGKNRSINLFTRVSLRERDIAAPGEGEPATPEADLGFNEYRVVMNYREPKAFGTPADVLITGILDQAIRSSFNFITREVRAEAGMRISARYGVAGRYSYNHTRLFDTRFTEEEQPLIDRLFPQVRLSKFSASVFRDTRNDVLDPERGMFLSLDNDVAMRAVGSEVGFVKTYMQALSYRRLPGQRRIVLALAARVGLGRGFERIVPAVGANGEPLLGPDGQPLVEIVEDLPASERFFAGGDTTVRGFSLDRLGNERTISASGFPTGGNGLVVLNAEARVAVWGAMTAVGFVDAGNVFPRASDLDFIDLRPAAGFGVLYRSPVGPIRINLGFNLDRRELVPGRIERASVLHVSFGHAF